MNKAETALSIVARVSEVESSTITPDMDLVADLGIDSTKALQLLVELEEGLGIEVSDEEAAKMSTVGDILDHITQRA